MVALGDVGEVVEVVAPDDGADIVGVLADIGAVVAELREVELSVSSKYSEQL